MDSARGKQDAIRRWWVWGTTLLAAALVAVDIALGDDVVLIGLLAVAPLIACMRAGALETGTLTLGCLAAGVLLGVPNDIFGETDHAVRILTLGCTGLVATLVAELRGQRERSVRQARTSGAWHAAIVDCALDALISIDHCGRVLEFNPAAERTFGYSREEALGKELAELVVPPQLRDRHRAGLERYLREGSSRILGKRIELTGMRADGTEFPVELTVTRVADREPPMFVGFARDITERRRNEKRLAHQAMHDALTGLPNRGLLMDRLALAVRRQSRSGGVTSVFFMDLDRFKSINDSLGHAAGDELLVTAARRFRRVLRPEDTLARISGDEFCAVCEGLADEEQAEVIAGRLTQALVDPVRIQGRDLFVTASVGVVTAARDGETPEGLLSAADAAMYSAKQDGKGEYTVFDERLRSRAGERLRLESELREALERRELEVFYQPQVDLRTGRTVGLEALARWRHPRRGLLGPLEFMTVAEETGLIMPLGEQVLEQACLDAARWGAGRTDRLLTVAVNLSALQFASQELATSVQRVLSRTGVEPTALCLEITEGTLMSSAATTSGVLTSLQELGVRLAIDDFGTGYSSLGYLRRLPVDQLKVDRSFIEGLGTRDDDRAIVSAVVSMGHSLGLSVLAEGIETDEQHDQLRELGCDLGQGFRFARPGPAAEVDEAFGDEHLELEAAS